MINNITIYGAGLIGSGWATHMICKNVPNVTVFDLGETQLEGAKARIRRDLGVLAEEGVLTLEEGEARLARLQFTTSKENLWGADLILENCPEDIELKQAVMADLEGYCRPDAIISSSTSGMSTTLIGAKMVHPQRLVGSHPYHPVHLLPLVEMVAGEKTDPAVVRTLETFLCTIGKEPVVLKKESPGYIASRLMSVLFRESAHIINSGIATMEDVDRAFTFGPGMRYGLMGINMTLQLAGGERGLAGTLMSGIGSSGGNWMESFANFTTYPDSFQEFWRTCQDQMDEEMEHRDALHGRTNPEIERFRDKGLIKLLECHGKL